MVNEFTRKKKTINLAPFSVKYIEYFKRSKTSRINVLEGSVRSGKTILNIMAFTSYMDSHPYGGNFVVSAISAGTAWEIVAECRGNSSIDGKYGAEKGFGLYYLLGGRVRKTKIKGSDALQFTNKKGKNCSIMFVGAGKHGATEMIRGITVSGWLATELPNHICDETEDFISFMFGRMLAGDPRHTKAFWDLNPTYATHRIYQLYLDRYSDPTSTNFLGTNYNYLHCTLVDNSSLTAEQIAETIKLYPDENSVEYKRDILGQRCSASGVIFTSFANNPNQYIINDFRGFIGEITPQFTSIGIDFGGNGSATTFVATLIYNNFKGVFIFADKKMDMRGGEKNTRDFDKELMEFVELVSLTAPAPIKSIYADCADVVMVNEVRLVINQMGLPVKPMVNNSYKGNIIDRIQAKQKLMSMGRWHVLHTCENVINSTASQLWNYKPGHEDERLDDGTCDVDTADAEEYSWSAFMGRLLRT